MTRPRVLVVDGIESRPPRLIKPMLTVKDDDGGGAWHRIPGDSCERCWLRLALIYRCFCEPRTGE